MKERHTISALVQDRPGALQRVAGLFSRRGYNIESVTVEASEEEGLSRMTIVVRADDRTRDQIVLQMRKLIDVLEAQPLAPGTCDSREPMPTKAEARPAERPGIVSLCLKG